MKKKFEKFIEQVNHSTKLFTPGPASLVLENLSGLRPCFGRGDLKYDKIEDRVLKNILKISGHKNIARLQGSASFALEIMIANFLFGNVLIIVKYLVDCTYIFSKSYNCVCESHKFWIDEITKIQNNEHGGLGKQYIPITENWFLN